ncbi:MAG TPA: enoyl-CoA hydratase-related protein [Acidimicrobiales bacterium]|nr:enoyl-CoA hydratase-related protein [Acidimicrobiales bacterium]
MPTGHIRYEVDDGVATITIDRPEKRNAMTYAVLADFTDAVWRAADDEAARVVIITGDGGAFCAGTDLSELDETPEDQRGSAARRDDERARLPWPIVQCPKPVIAAIDGPAVGMGVEFATQADVRIASDRAKLGWIFVKRGLVPDTGAGSFLLPRQVGATEALRLLLSGEVIDAAEALRIGFVSQVVPPDDLLAAARAEAERYLEASPFAIARTKRLVYQAMAAEVAAHVGETGRMLQECFHSEDHAEGVKAFLERRPARFTGR